LHKEAGSGVEGPLPLDSTELATAMQEIKDKQQLLFEKVESWQSGGGKETEQCPDIRELAEQQTHIAEHLAELGAEIRDSLKRQNTAVATLDEQLWLTGERLGQRIDELEQRVSDVRGPLEGTRAKKQDNGAAPPTTLWEQYESMREAQEEAPGVRTTARLNASHGRRSMPNISSRESTDGGHEARLGAGRSVPSISSRESTEVEHEAQGVLRPLKSVEGPPSLLEQKPSAAAEEEADPATAHVSERMSRSLGSLVMGRTGSGGFRVSDAMATATQALGGSDEEEKRQLSRLARLERLQERVRSPSNCDDATSAMPEEESQICHVETVRVHESRRSSEATISSTASADSAATARAARRRGPFSRGTLTLSAPG
jgi:hypothetical protein